MSSDTISILLTAKQTGVSFSDFVTKLQRSINESTFYLNLPILKSPFDLYRFSELVPTTGKHLGNRAFLVNDTFVYKYDEQPLANELSFITNLFALVCDIKAPNMILAHVQYHLNLMYDGTKILENVAVVAAKSSAQIIEYISDWKNYTDTHPRSDKFTEQLAQLLAFDLIVNNTDRFLFIWRYIDNIIFRDDPDYEQVYLWDEPQINEGNFGFVGNDLYSLDHRSSNELSDITRVHQLLSHELLDQLSVLMSEFFKLNEDELNVFKLYLQMYVRDYLDKFPMFIELLEWISNV